MVKPKQKYIPRALNSKRKIQGVSGVDPDLGEWTVVKKQRVIIVIPALSSTGQSKLPPVGESELQLMPQGNSLQSQCPSGIPSLTKLPHDKERSKSSSHELITPSVKIIHRPEPAFRPERPSISSLRTSSKDSSLHSLRDGRNLGVCGSLEGNERKMIFDLSSGFLNQKMRSSYLEKKLKKAGGLENWLVSLGLGRFVKIFQRSVNRFHLANLTMKKLKDMGTHSVGPRRKLLHAIDCLCEPHCFQQT